MKYRVYASWLPGGSEIVEADWYEILHFGLLSFQNKGFYAVKKFKDWQAVEVVKETDHDQ